MHKLKKIFVLVLILSMFVSLGCSKKSNKNSNAGGTPVQGAKALEKEFPGLQNQNPGEILKIAEKYYTLALKNADNIAKANI